MGIFKRALDQKMDILKSHGSNNVAILIQRGRACLTLFCYFLPKFALKFEPSPLLNSSYKSFSLFMFFSTFFVLIKTHVGLFQNLILPKTELYYFWSKIQSTIGWNNYLNFGQRWFAGGFWSTTRRGAPAAGGGRAPTPPPTPRRRRPTGMSLHF